MFAQYIFKHPRYFALLIISVFAVGINSFSNIPRQEEPTLTNFGGTVLTFYPGATPDRVEALVTKPLEDELRKISELDKLMTTSSSGVSSMQVRLDDTLPDHELERVWSEVRDALSDAYALFPPGVGIPTLDTDRFQSFNAIVAMSGRDDADIPLSLLGRMAEDLADRARNMDGTKLAVLFGEPAEEIRVEINEDALVARGLSLAEVSAALRAADAKVSSGRATGEGTDMLIEIAGDFDSLTRIREVIVNTSANGSATRIADLGRVYKAAITPPSSLVLVQGKPGIMVGVAMEDGRQVDRWAQEFSLLLRDYINDAPASVLVEQTFDQSTYAKSRLADVTLNLAIGITLVLLVLLFTLGWRAAVVVAIILPLCGLISMVVMERTGMALHQMTICGLIVALGLLVDGSIVMTDEIRKRLLQEHTPYNAIAGAVDRLRVPLLSSTLTTILAFMPMAIMPGPGGDFLGAIAQAVIIMLVTSTALALIVTPVLASWLLPRTKESSRHWYNGGMDGGKMGEALSNAMDWSLKHPAAAIALALALPLSGFISFPTLTAQFFPGTDRDQMYIQVKLADGRSIYDTLQVVERLDERLRSDPMIRRVDWTLGESTPAFYYNMYRSRDGTPSWAEALVLTRDENQTDDLIRALQLELDRDFPEARIIVNGIYQGPPVTAPIELEIHGPNLAVLQELGEEFRLRMDNLPHIIHTGTNLIGGAPKVVFHLDEERLRLANLQLTDAATALNDSLLGRVGGEVLEGTERLPVRVRLSEAEWGTPDRIVDIRLPRRGGSDTLAGVPLNAIGSPALEPAQSPIARQDGVRINTVQGYITRGVLPEEVLKLLQQDLVNNPINLPPGYSIVYGGDTDERARVVEKIMAPMGLIVSVLIATIVLTFNSWRLTGIALLVCLCSMGLSLLSLALFQYPFGVMSLVGVIGSIGVSINAAIIILTALQANPAAVAGGRYAIRTVVMDSSRHIISTTVTTFGGFLPLILEGSEFWPPFAMAIAGGVLLSTIISFFLVPPLFLLTVRKQRGMGFGPLKPSSSEGSTA
ncbi:acriflavine resistance protein B [Halioglobus sp. HI00S01]|uniref:efflux RND transporter permease subunit n=1 Tax=Halioglobus sp. HI00S01 TaxID=1822214 RepID=UPI0007C38E7E|nr:efflux RND transporter permease subunit [Halioglobus sp. HI00S01]KZX60185.1 acriflavine resistance protein B [Halioglobus sp. HI00S01]